MKEFAHLALDVSNVSLGVLEVQSNAEYPTYTTAPSNDIDILFRFFDLYNCRRLGRMR